MSGEVAYLDTSAALKLLVPEAESAALRRELRRWARRASSSLLRVELARVVMRAGLPGLLSTVRRQLDAIHLIGLDDALLRAAAEVEPWSVRSLDAIHLAAALSLGDDLGTLLTYDRRMAEGARAIGLPAASPG